MSMSPSPVPCGWRVPIQDFDNAMKSAGAPTTTRRTRLEHLRRLARNGGWATPWDVDAEGLLTWVGKQSWAVETRRSWRSTLRAFWRWAVATGRCDLSPADALPTIHTTQPLPRPAPDDVLRAAIATADARTAVILRLAAEAGLRRGEIAVIHDRDVIQDLDGWSLLVHGKGRRQRLVPLTRELGVVVRTRTARLGWLLPGDDDGHLSPRWVGKLATNALPGDWTLHTLRHRFATRAYGIDRDVFTVQRLLGHASPATTQRYVALDITSLRDTVERAARDPESRQDPTDPPTQSG